MNPNTLRYFIRVIEGALAALGASPEVIARWRETSGRVKTMVEEKRDPTPQEWGELDNEIAANSKQRDQIIAGKKARAPKP